jgi:predicted  nucleic acid-binding Zn-ribbon protein
VGRYNTDDSRVPHTCPLINEVIDAVKSVEWNDEDYYNEKDLVDTLEQIRSANGNLRDWGCDKNQEIHDLNDEIDDLKTEIRRLTEQLDEVNQEVIELQEQIDEYNQ